MVANVVRDSKIRGSRFIRASSFVSLSPLYQKVPELSIKTSTDASVICPQSVHFYGQNHARREKASLRVVQLFYRKIFPASSSSSRRRTRTKSGDRSGR